MAFVFVKQEKGELTAVKVKTNIFTSPCKNNCNKSINYIILRKEPVWCM
jgi:hypothetical protein